MAEKISQCARILVILGDGREHSFHQILRAVPCVVHSRIAELRSRGNDIECRRVGDDYLYRLTVRDAKASDAPARAAATAPGAFKSPAGCTARPLPVAPAGQQLALIPPRCGYELEAA